MFIKLVLKIKSNIQWQLEGFENGNWIEYKVLVYEKYKIRTQLCVNLKGVLNRNQI
jgi:hypothetical protein